MAEFLAIFAGVTLSLLADDWRQAREDRTEERSLLIGLRADLRTDSVEQHAVLDWAERHSAGAVWLTLRLENGPPIPDDSLQSRLGEVTFSGNYDPVSATYVALKEGGRMSIIADAGLRDRITDCYERYQAGAATLHENVQDEIWTWRQTFFAYFEVPVTDTTSTFSLTRFRAVRPWSEFARDPDVRRQVVQIGISGGVEVRSLPSILARNGELAGEIEHYLAAR